MGVFCLFSNPKESFDLNPLLGGAIISFFFGLESRYSHMIIFGWLQTLGQKDLSVQYFKCAPLPQNTLLVSRKLGCAQFKRMCADHVEMVSVSGCLLCEIYEKLGTFLKLKKKKPLLLRRKREKQTILIDCLKERLAHHGSHERRPNFFSVSCLCSSLLEIGIPWRWFSQRKRSPSLHHHLSLFLLVFGRQRHSCPDQMDAN